MSNAAPDPEGYIEGGEANQTLTHLNLYPLKTVAFSATLEDRADPQLAMGEQGATDSSLVLRGQAKKLVVQEELCEGVTAVLAWRAVSCSGTTAKVQLTRTNALAWARALTMLKTKNRTSNIRGRHDEVRRESSQDSVEAE